MAKVDVMMPQMGESVMEGTVIEWTKQIGDIVEVPYGKTRITGVVWNEFEKNST